MSHRGRYFACSQEEELPPHQGCPGGTSQHTQGAGGALQTGEQLTFPTATQAGPVCDQRRMETKGYQGHLLQKGTPSPMPQSLQHQYLRSATRQGRTGPISQAGTEQRHCYLYTTGLAPLFADLLQQKQKLAGQALLVSLVSPNPSFSLFHHTSLVFPSKLRGLASAPQLWRLQLAKLQALAVSHLQTGFT